MDVDALSPVFEYSAAALAGRPVVEGYTVDDQETRDMDDGLRVERTGDGWRVWISIADASIAVPAGSKMDRRAFLQGFTLYRPGQNITMLPRELDHDRLSLVAGALRPAITVEVGLDENFQVTDRRIYHSAFKSLQKLSYENFLDESETPDDRFHAWSQLGEGLLQLRRNNGALTLSDLKKGLYVDEEGDLRPVESNRHRGYMFVQETMLLANRVVAEFARDNGIPVLYRNHAADADDGESGPRLLYSIREALAVNSKPDYIAAIKKLRLWFQRARYEADLKGHFGLQMPAYLHFTSPIRRYADMVVHRNLKDFLEGRPFTYGPERLAAFAAHLNRRGDEERDHHHAEVYKDVLYNRMHRRVLAPGAVFTAIGDDELRTAIKVAHYEGVDHKHLAAEIRRRLKMPGFPLNILSRLLVEVESVNPYWMELKGACLAYLNANPRRADELLTFSIKKYRDWHGHAFQRRLLAQGGLAYHPMVTILGQPLSPPFIPTGTNKRSAREAACIAFWNAYVKRTLVPSDQTRLFDERNSAQLVKPPFKLVHEFAQKSGWPDPQADFHAHARNDHECTLRLVTGQGAELISRGRDATARLAKHAAARSLLPQLVGA